jgi:predicted DNA-binding transcriptional regulator AlpA
MTIPRDYARRERIAAAAGEARMRSPRHVLSETEAAEYIGMSRAYLRAARTRERGTPGPPYLRVGRAIRYLVADLDVWLERHRIVPADR